MMAAMQKLGRIVALAIVLFACVSCDQATKAVAQEHLSATQPIWLFNGLVRLQVAENPGAFLSLGAELPPAVQYWLFTGMVAAVLAGFLIFILKEAQKMHMIVLVGVALLVGGGIGNLIDRVVNGGRCVARLSLGVGAGGAAATARLADVARQFGRHRRRRGRLPGGVAVGQIQPGGRAARAGPSAHRRRCDGGAGE
jgi:signal peptidase II